MQVARVITMLHIFYGTVYYICIIYIPYIFMYMQVANVKASLVFITTHQLYTYIFCLIVRLYLSCIRLRVFFWFSLIVIIRSSPSYILLSVSGLEVVAIAITVQK